tara:strand:- start:1244 stop:2755 length:1512 start_codon:yes stop_codon:yes gene_type:complete
MINEIKPRKKKKEIKKRKTQKEKQKKRKIQKKSIKNVNKLTIKKPKNKSTKLYLKKDFTISNKHLDLFSKTFNADKTNRVIKNVNTKNDFKRLVINSDYHQNLKKKFKNFIDVDSPVTDQSNSGRCWIFAFLNVIRINMIKKYKLQVFEFSQNFLFFYDKLEKANYFINYIISSIELDHTNDAQMISILKEATNDGGFWNIFVNLIEKYGIVPKDNMNDLFHSENTFQLSEFYNDYLKTVAHKIRNTNKKKLNKNKKTIIANILSECYKILTIFLGEPPKKFTWEYYTMIKGKKVYRSVKDITPLEFYKKYVPYNVHDKVGLINYPCPSKPYYRLFNIENAFNIFNGIKLNFINVPNDIIVEGIKKSIDNKEALWIAMDTAKYMSNKLGFYDESAFNFKDVFGFKNELDKCNSLEYRLSEPNHAVIIKGYNKDKKNVSGFLIENSWGVDVGFEGHFYMALDWFNKYNYQVVIDKKYLPKKVVDVLKQREIILPYNSPFGAVMK